MALRIPSLVTCLRYLGGALVFLALMAFAGSGHASDNPLALSVKATTVSLTINHMYRCRGTKVGPRVVLTAAHCLGNFGSDLVIAVDGISRHPVKIVNDGHDHVFLYFNAIFVNFAHFSHSWIQQGDSMFMFGDMEGYHGLFRKGYYMGYASIAEIEAHGDPHFLASMLSDSPTLKLTLKDVVMFYDCNTFPGDSGSALFNSDGEIVTVLTGGLEWDTGISVQGVTTAFPLMFTPAQIAEATSF